MIGHERWFPLPDQYRMITNPKTLKRYAIWYMDRNHRGWKPVRIENYQVLAKWEGKDEVD